MEEDDRLQASYLSIISSHSALDFTDWPVNLSSKLSSVVGDIYTLISWSWPQLLFIKPLLDESDESTVK